MHILKTLFKFIFSFFKIFIVFMSIVVLEAYLFVYFNIPIKFSEQMFFAIIFILSGIYGLIVIKKVFKETKVWKPIYFLFSYIAPSSSMLFVSLLVNLFK